MTLLLQCNPYNSALPVEDIREQFEKEKATLDEIKPKDKSEEERQKLAEEKNKQWKDIEKLLEDFDEDEEVENPDKLWENASPGEVHERIRHHLMQHKFEQAVSLLTEAKEVFPIFKNLENDDEGRVFETLFRFLPN